jgi:hypothetical protein
MVDSQKTPERYRDSGNGRYRVVMSPGLALHSETKLAPNRRLFRGRVPAAAQFLQPKRRLAPVCVPDRARQKSEGDRRRVVAAEAPVVASLDRIGASTQAPTGASALMAPGRPTSCQRP